MIDLGYCPYDVVQYLIDHHFHQKEIVTIGLRDRKYVLRFKLSKELPVIYSLDLSYEDKTCVPHTEKRLRYLFEEQVHFILSENNVTESFFSIFKPKRKEDISRNIFDCSRYEEYNIVKIKKP